MSEFGMWNKVRRSWEAESAKLIKLAAKNESYWPSKGKSEMK
jgi:hypothetical protein